MKKLKTLFVKKSPFSIAASTAMLILIALGIADTLLLVYSHLYSGGACENFGILGGSCDTVTQSEYGVVLDIPISIFGLIGYFLLLMLVLFSFFTVGMFPLMLVVTFFGLATSLYLVYVQAFILKAWCPLCLISAGNFFLLFVFSTMLFFRSLPLERNKKTAESANPNTASENSAQDDSRKEQFGARQIRVLPSLKVVRFLTLIVLVFTFFSLLFFEGVRGRQLLKEKSVFSKATAVGCGMRTSASLAATINGELVFFNDIDPSINFDNLEACKEINVYRMHAVNLMLLRQKSSEENNTVAKLLANLGMTPSLAELVKSPESLKTALSLDTQDAQTAVNEALAKLRNEYAVKLNF